MPFMVVFLPALLLPREWSPAARADNKVPAPSRRAVPLCYVLFATDHLHGRVSARPALQRPGWTLVAITEASQAAMTRPSISSNGRCRHLMGRPHERTFTMPANGNYDVSGPPSHLRCASVIGSRFRWPVQPALLCATGSGLSAQVLEMAPRHWRDTVHGNRYPGIAVRPRKPCHFTFRGTDASGSGRSAILEARDSGQPRRRDKFDLKRAILQHPRDRGGLQRSAEYLEVRTDAGERLTANFLITAVGCLSAANVPSIPGLESFEAAGIHGRWSQRGVDFSGSDC